MRQRTASSSVDPIAPRRRTHRLWLALAALASVVFSLACDPTACDEASGACQTTCTDDTCSDGARCVNDLCRPSCDTQAPCRGGDTCQKIDTDYGTRGKYCYGPRRDNDPYRATGGDGSSTALGCTANRDCPQVPAQSCVEGICLTTCLTHDHCGSAGSCSGEATDIEDHTVFFCEADAFPHAAGQFGSMCLNGNLDCDAAEGFRCRSGGEGDAESYCTRAGCDADSECPDGYACQAQSLRGVPPCTSACGLVGDATDPECVPTSDIGTGKAVNCRADQAGLELRMCAKREFCSECERDADCRGRSGQICARGADGTKACTQLCDPETSGCPWGSATECKLYDAGLGVPTCGHRSESCRGSGNSCDPCIDDRDCPRGFCSNSDFTGERFCVALDDTCACAEGQDSCLGGGCPATPGGLAMNCISRDSTSAPSACFGALTSEDESASQLGCWPE
jgi:hypothetical protein